MLESVRRSIVNGYATRCGDKATRRQLENMVNRETWLSAQEALDIGLADGILGQEDGDSSGLALSVVNSVGNGIRSLAGNNPGGHSPAELLARYEAAVRAGAEPAAGHPVQPEEPAAPEIVDPDGGAPSDSLDIWRRKARLAIEQNRFI